MDIIIRSIEWIIIFLMLYVTVFNLVLFIRERNNKKDLKKRNNQKPTVSVVIPAHNEERFIARCIDSVLGSDYPREKLEVIVVNDGSSDRTGEILNKYNGGIKIITREVSSGTRAGTLNDGLKYAKGEIIIALDGDSYIKKSSIKKLVNHFDDDVGAVAAAMSGHQRKNMNLLEKFQVIEYDVCIFIRKMLSAINGVYIVPGPLSAFKREIFDELGYFDTTAITDDQEMTYRVQSSHYKVIGCTDAEVYSELPQTLGDLFKQRIRWNRGSLQNLWRYKHLTRAEYGDFGVFVMPANYFFLVFLLFVLNRIAASLSHMFSAFDIIFYLDSVLAFSAIFIILAITSVYIGLKYVGKRIVSIPFIIFYVFVYGYLIPIFSIVAIAIHIANIKFKW